MKYTFIITFLLLILTSCVKDDSVIPCGTECVELTGKIVSNEGFPLSGIEVRFEYKIPNPPTSKTRIIAKGKTDGDGLYKIKGLINDDELGDTTDGYFRRVIEFGSLNDSEFLGTGEKIDAFYEIYQKDTIIQESFFIPRKTSVVVRLLDFAPVHQFDNINVQISPIAEENYNIEPALSNKTIYTGGGYAYLTEDFAVSDTTFIVHAGADLYNRIRVFRKINNEATIENFIEFIPESNELEFSYTY